MPKLVFCMIVAGMVAIASSAVPAGEERSFEKGIVVSETNSITAVVEKIDHQARTATLKGPQGGTVELKVDQSAKNFDQVQQGDLVTLNYFASLLLKRQRSADAPVRAETSVMQSVPTGQKPKVVKVDTIDGLVTIESINAKDRTVSVRNAKGELKTHAIGDEVKDFDALKIGDQIYYSYTQAVALEVTKPFGKTK